MYVLIIVVVILFVAVIAIRKRNKRIGTIEQRIDRYESVTEEEFKYWRKRSRYPLYVAYKDYLRQLSRPMQDRDRLKQIAFYGSPEGQKDLEKMSEALGEMMGTKKGMDKVSLELKKEYDRLTGEQNK